MTSRQVARVMVALAMAGEAACGGGTEPPPGEPAPLAHPVDPATAGSLTGRVLFDGTAPAPQPITMRSDPNCGPTGTATTETLLVNDGRLQNVFVYVKDGLGALRFPVPSTPVVLDQQGCRYTPHVLGVQIGQPLEIRNSDATLHNVHAVAAANREFNTGQPVQGMRHTHTFSTVEVMVPFKCDVHGWMHAFVGALDHPFFAVSGDDGSFQIPGLPPGTYTVEAWHERLGTQTQTVTIRAQDASDLTLRFKG